jgi:DNA-binding NarL/FixJ family response regulator
MINVAIIEDDRDIREGIQKYINHQPEMVCEVADESVERFLSRSLAEDYPDVFLMDIGLPGMSGLNGTALIKESHPEVDIIMLTVYTDWDRIFGALRARASGYLLKNTPLAEIKRSIEVVRSGGAAMAPQIARKVMEFFGEQKGPTREPDTLASERHLTAREGDCDRADRRSELQVDCGPDGCLSRYDPVSRQECLQKVARQLERRGHPHVPPGRRVAMTLELEHADDRPKTSSQFSLTRKRCAAAQFCRLGLPSMRLIRPCSESQANLHSPHHTAITKHRKKQTCEKVLGSVLVL